MPRYRIKTEPAALVEDQAIDLPDLDAAKAAALEHLIESLRRDAGAFWTDRYLRVVASDQAGLDLFSLEVSAAIAPVISRR